MLSSVFIEHPSKLLRYTKINGGKFCGFKLSVKSHPCDVIEWLSGINFLNLIGTELALNGMNGLNGIGAE